MAGQGKTQTAYILEAVFTSNDQSTDAPPEFWHDLYDSLEQKGVKERSINLRGHTYRGKAGRLEATGQRYIYLGKVRSGSDLPDVSDAPGSDETEPLEVMGDVLEYLYVHGFGSDSKCVALRSSGGPTFSALESWLAAMLDMIQDKQAIHLRPVVRRDALARLKRASGATKVDMKFEPEAELDTGGSSDIARAYHELGDSLGGAVSIEMGISFGNARPSEMHAEHLAREVLKIVGTPGVKRLKTTLIEDDGEERRSRDTVDLLRDRITYKVAVGRSTDERHTPDVVLAAMADAVSQYRGRAKERS